MSDESPKADPTTLLAQIERWRDNVLDFDIIVDDKRQAVDRAVGELQEAVRQRDAAAVHLDHLIAWHAETGGPHAG